MSIDGISCDVQSATSTQIQCITGSRLFLPTQTSFCIEVGGNKAILNGNKFIYIMRWSDERTWGTDLPPVENDLVYVPQGMSLFVDVSPPFLEGIIVEGGSLIFADEADLEIHTNFITINKG